MGWNDAIKRYKDLQQSGNTTQAAALDRYAYVDRETVEYAKDNSYVTQASQELMKVANSIMKQLEEANHSPMGVDQNGVVYPSKAIVKVSPMMTKDGSPIVHDYDGSAAHSLTMTIKNINDYIKLYAKEDFEKGLEFSNITATVLDGKKLNNEGKEVNKYKTIKIDGLEDKSLLSAGTAEILDQIKLTGYVKTYGAATISEETQKLMQTNPKVKEICDDVVATANKIMSTLSENDLTPKKINSRGEEYSPKALITIKPSETLKHENGEPVYTPQISLANGNDYISFYTKESRDKISSIIASSITTDEEGKSTRHTYKLNEFDKSILSNKTIQIAQLIDASELMAEKEYSNEPAYIEKNTFETAKTDAYYEKASKLALETATNIMNALYDAGIVPTSTTKSGEEYNTKAVVKIEHATKFNKDTLANETLYHDDGTPVNSISISIRVGKDTLILNAKENVENGLRLSNMGAVVWHMDEQRNREISKYVDDKDFTPSTASEKLIAIADVINKEGFIKEISPMEQYAMNIARQFNQYGDKIVNEEGQLVNEAYAIYENDVYGEKVRLGTRNGDKTVVDLRCGETGYYATITNFNENMKDKETGAYPSITVSCVEDIMDCISNQQIQKIVAACVYSNDENARNQAMLKINSAQLNNRNQMGLQQ